MTKRIALSFIFLFLVGCSGQEPVISDENSLETILDETVTPEIVIEEAYDLAIDNMQVVVEESSPIQVAVIVNGTLPDRCISIVRIRADYDNSGFKLNILTRREIGLECEPDPHSFEEYVFLDVDDLPEGTYQVSLNELSESFTLEENDEIPEYESG